MIQSVVGGMKLPSGPVGITGFSYNIILRASVDREKSVTEMFGFRFIRITQVHEMFVCQ